MFYGRFIDMPYCAANRYMVHLRLEFIVSCSSKNHLFENFLINQFKWTNNYFQNS